MYYYIKGELAAKGSNYVVVDAAGVGYMIYTPAGNIEKAGAVGSEIIMYTYLNVREDIMELYGFITPEEKEMFLRLISVSGVGPKAALAILTVSTPQQLAAAIIKGDTRLITKAQGVGPKAEQGELITDAKAEAMSALIALGYSSSEARSALSRLDSGLSTEELIKQALARLM